MPNIYFTVTGLHHYYGESFLEKRNGGLFKERRR